MPDEATRDGQHLIATWLSSQEREKRLRGELNRAECDTSNTARELAKWMMPADAKSGEKICVWHGDSLFQVEVGDTGRDPVVTVRTRGKHFSELSRVA